MPQDAKTRIDTRNREAETHMADQGVFRRAMSQLGLGTANMIDRVTGIGDSDNAVFKRSIAIGALHGACMGILAGMIGVALGAGSLFFIGAIAAGAIGFAIYDGQKELEYHQYNKPERVSDKIAEKSGAVRTKSVKMTNSPGETSALAGRDPSFSVRVDNILAQHQLELLREGANESIGTEQQSFQAREDARRAPAPSQGQGR